MPRPVNLHVCHLFDRLPILLKEDFEERAAIMEFESRRPRELSEALAMLDVLVRHPHALSGVRFIELVGRKSDRWLVVNEAFLLGHQRELRGGLMQMVDAPTHLLHEHFRGRAVLSPIE